MEELIQILEGCCPDVDFEKETALIDDGVLSSLDVVMIVGELNEAYDITITVDALEPENFNSAEAMYALVERLRCE